MSRLPNVFSIPPGAPFLPTLAEACLDGSLGFRLGSEDRDLSAATILVPTRRAARALAHAFAERLKPRALLLPRIVPLGDPADLEEAAILDEEPGLSGADPPPAIDPLRRRLELAKLVEAWRVATEREAGGEGFTLGGGFADSLALADDLARLIDEAHVEGADWSRLGGLVDRVFDQHWERTRRFLEIAAGAWPAMLAEAGLLDAADRRNRLLRAEAERLKARPPGEPVIAAGSTGSMPATAELLAAVARLPKGAVVLPGLDLVMDAAAWATVPEPEAAGEGAHGHPQAMLKRLLGRMGVSRADIRELGAPAPALAARGEVASLAALPAEATESWGARRGSVDIDAALAGVAVVEAQDEREEAAAIAVALREVLERPDATAALVTPDRALAERVAVELRRWNVTADDSAGLRLDRTAAARLAALILNAVGENVSAASLLALLDHPLSGAEPAARAALELAACRGLDRPRGLDDLARRAGTMEDRAKERHAPRPLKRLTPQAIAAGRELASRVGAALAPLVETAETRLPLAVFAERHAAALTAIAADAWLDAEGGSDVARLLDALAGAKDAPAIGFDDYAAIFRRETGALLARRPSGVEGRIRIWGLLEARLLSADRLVLGGLNEGIWPGQPRPDPFLNRAMRAALGLSQPERRIGQAAHDFAQALGAPEVVVTRALVVEGTPMTASRFLRRLDAFAGADAARAMRARAGRILASARALDAGADEPPAARPAPRPPAALQPRSLSITDVATLYRDPYAIYARDVLGLDALPEVDLAPGAADRGNLIHEAMARFVEEASAAWPADPLARLLEIGREAFAPLMGEASVRAFWWPMFEKAAAFLVEDVAARRADVRAAAAERSGRLPIPLEDGETFELRGRADLIEKLKDGRLAMTDYKTGGVPSQKEVQAGLQPQLTLAAAMARRGVFEGAAAGDPAELRYVKIGSQSKVLTIRPAEGDDDLAALAERHLAMLARVVAAHRRGERPYLSRRMPKHADDAGPYDHLARVAEWRSADDGG